MTQNNQPNSDPVSSSQRSSNSESASVSSLGQLEIRARSSPLLGLRNVTKHPLVIFLGALFLGFTSGVAAYRIALDITNQETVIKNSYILKSELTGTILRNEAVREIDHLIENGMKLNNDEEITKWLGQVLTFVQEINLEKSTIGERGQKISNVEANIWFALKDPKIRVQAQKVLGVLKGWRSALSAQRDVR